MEQQNRIVKVEFINDPWEEGRFVITRRNSGSRTYMIHAHEHWLRRWRRAWIIIDRFEGHPTPGIGEVKPLRELIIVIGRELGIDKLLDWMTIKLEGKTK